MAGRYEVIAEWYLERKRFRIYDKHCDALLDAFDTMEDALKQCTAIERQGVGSTVNDSE